MNTLNKRDAYTVLGIFVAICFPIGGWKLTKEMIDRKEESSFFEAGVIQLTRPTSEILKKEELRSDTIDQPREPLSNKEIYEILENWNSKEPEKPHEPIGAQINMEQAIETGEAWISDVISKELIPMEYFENVKTSARLCVKLEDSQKISLKDEKNSYWEVRFENDDLTVYLTINAYTGQVWSSNIVSYLQNINFDDVLIEQVLSNFTNYLDFYDEDFQISLQSVEGQMVSTCDKNENLYAVVRKNDVAISKSGDSKDFKLGSALLIYLDIKSPAK